MLKVGKAVVVDATRVSIIGVLRLSSIVVPLIFGLTSSHLFAAVLPDDRADILLHSYNGGGMGITGPSILVRKQVHKSVSLVANHYIDKVSSASIDVVSQASEYSEDRTENSVGVDFLNQKAMLNLGYTSSEENDFSAKTIHFGISQDFFGDLTNLSLGYSRGNDEVGKVGDLAFRGDVVRQHYRLAISQILTKNMLFNAGWETIADQGFLGNPYRVVRYEDVAAARQFSYLDERYPLTRTSSALALESIYYLPYRASVHLRYRFFNDSWGISAHDIQARYVHTFRDKWIVEGSYRFYTQDSADFYGDLFPFAESQNFYARDKELSTFQDHSVGFGLSYEYKLAADSFVKKASVNFFYTFIHFRYDDFRDVTALQGDGSFYDAGEEPLFRFSAGVTRFYVSCWY